MLPLSLEENKGKPFFTFPIQVTSNVPCHITSTKALSAIRNYPQQTASD